MMHEQAKDDIRHLIDVFFRAHANREWAAVRDQHNQRWCGFSLNARSLLRNRDAHVNEVQAMLQSTSLIDYEMIDIDYVFYGSVCIVPYIARLRTGRSEGGVVETKVRILDVYAREDGHWRQAASHMSLHPDTVPPAGGRTALIDGAEGV